MDINIPMNDEELNRTYVKYKMTMESIGIICMLLFMAVKTLVAIIITFAFIGYSFYVFTVHKDQQIITFCITMIGVVTALWFKNIFSISKIKKLFDDSTIKRLTRSPRSPTLPRFSSQENDN